MSSLVLPSLAGVKLDVKRTPIYSTQIQQSTSGMELRSSFWTYPRYKVTLNFEFLRSASYTRATMNEWETLIGFFARMAGTYDTFYFQMPDDYYVGNITNYKENATVPATSTYTITVANTTGWNDISVYDTTSTSLMVKVGSSPTAGQYTSSAGVYTFNSADASHAVQITYTTSIPSSTTSMPFGVGDATTTAFQLQRTLVPSAALPAAASRTYFPSIGNGYEPIFVTNSTPSIYVNSTLKTAGTHYNISNGLVTFTTGNIPSASQILSWTGSYYWNVRLEKDEYDFQRMCNGFWDAKTINLLTVKS